MMNKDNAKEYIKLLQALLDGEEIEYLDFSHNGKEKWVSVDSLCFVNPSRYRIKPKPKPEYRPFTFDEFLDLVLSKKFILKFYYHPNTFCAITTFGKDYITVSDTDYSYKQALDLFILVLEDKKEQPCGVKIEERYDKIQLKV